MSAFDFPMPLIIVFLIIIIICFCGPDRTRDDSFRSHNSCHVDLEAGRPQASTVFTYTGTTGTDCAICLEDVMDGQKCRLFAKRKKNPYNDVLSTFALAMGCPLTIMIFFCCKDHTPNYHFPSDDAWHDDLEAI
ncbi:unnamed protein product [Prunus brigantina]